MKKSCWNLLAVLIMVCFLLSACQMLSNETIKLRDLNFTVQSEETMPAEVLKMINEKKEEPFRFTFTDDKNLYICIGYGKQEGGGYSITVDSLYLTENAIYVETTLLGPEHGESDRQITSYPCIVLKTEALKQTVICK